VSVMSEDRVRTRPGLTPVHYVETRDQLEAKIAHINKKLAKLIQEGEHVRDDLGLRVEVS